MKGSDHGQFRQLQDPSRIEVLDFLTVESCLRKDTLRSKVIEEAEYLEEETLRCDASLVICQQMFQKS